MISIIASFRFCEANSLNPKNRELINSTFNYWEVVRKFFNLELIFINDHSENFWLEKDFIFPMKGEKKDWNFPSAKNYASTFAKGENLIFTDIDHVMYGDFHLLERSAVRGCYYTFPRMFQKDGNYRPINRHPNTFLIKKNEFIRYDEDFCGNYGHDDTEFLFRLNKTHKKVLSENIVTAYCTGLASANLNRDVSINTKLLKMKTVGK